MIFRADPNNAGDEELWRFDGMSAARIEDLWPGPDGSFAYGLTKIGGRLYFGATEPTLGNEIFWYDGAIIHRTPEITPGFCASDPTGMTGSVNGVYFAARRNCSGDIEPYRYDPAVDTMTLMDIASFYVFGSGAGQFVRFNNTTYFTASDAQGLFGSELWVTDGQPAPGFPNPFFSLINSDVLGFDCNDGFSLVHPGAPELANGFDDNCNGVTDEATFTATTTLTATPTETAVPTPTNTSSPTATSTATETAPPATSSPTPTRTSPTIPGNIKPATYFLLVCADARHDVPESDQRNNCLASATAIGVFP